MPGINCFILYSYQWIKMQTTTWYPGSATFKVSNVIFYCIDYTSSRKDNKEELDMLMKVLVSVLAMLAFSASSMAGNKGLMGALIGAGVGAGVGHAVDRTGGSGKGAIIGAIGGYVIGNQMEKSDQGAAQSQAAQPPAQTS